MLSVQWVVFLGAQICAVLLDRHLYFAPMIDVIFFVWPDRTKRYFINALAIFTRSLPLGNNGGVQVQTIRAAVKFPVTEHTLTEMFQPSHTCIKENSFYTKVIPELIQLQYECGFDSNDMIDVFIRCYGARLSLDPGNYARSLKRQFFCSTEGGRVS